MQLVPLGAHPADDTCHNKERLHTGEIVAWGQSVCIWFDLPQAAAGSVCVRDLTGRLVRVLRLGTFAHGRQTITWDGRGDGGETLPSGIYFVSFDTAAGVQDAVKVTLLK